MSSKIVVTFNVYYITESIAVWIIALGVVLGFLLIVGIAIILFLIYRRKHAGSGIIRLY